MSKRDDLVRRLEAAKASYDALEGQYGTGVRPSWVSAELAFEWMKVESAKQELAKFEGEQA